MRGRNFWGTLFPRRNFSKSSIRKKVIAISNFQKTIIFGTQAGIFGGKWTFFTCWPKSRFFRKFRVLENRLLLTCLTHFLTFFHPTLEKTRFPIVFCIKIYRFGEIYVQNANLGTRWHQSWADGSQRSWADDFFERAFFKNFGSFGGCFLQQGEHSSIVLSHEGQSLFLLLLLSLVYLMDLRHLLLF